MLVRLLYASRATQSVDKELINDIMATSRGANEQHGITGVLCTCSAQNVFLQLLEGSRREVNALYNNIARDSRHEECTLLHYQEVDERRFSSWRMGCVDLNKVNLSTILRFSESAKLDPFTMTGAGAMALLEELEKTAAIISKEA